MSVNLKQMDAYVSGSTVVFDESSQSVPTKDLASVDSETTVDTILGVKDGVVSQIDTADFSATKINGIKPIKIELASGYHREITIPASTRGWAFFSGTQGSTRGILFYNVTSTGGYSGYFLPGTASTVQLTFSASGNVLTVSNTSTGYACCLWVSYNQDTVTVGDQIAN